jgi:PBP1b-binding outer membrane lipoprotein LpoB
MRILRVLSSPLLILVVTLGCAVLLSGCSHDSGQVDVNKKEQQLLQEQIQKGFTKRPIARRPGRSK